MDACLRKKFQPNLRFHVCRPLTDFYRQALIESRLTLTVSAFVLVASAFGCSFSELQGAVVRSEDARLRGLPRDRHARGGARSGRQGDPVEAVHVRGQVHVHQPHTGRTRDLSLLELHTLVRWIAAGTQRSVASLLLVRSHLRASEHLSSLSV